MDWNAAYPKGMRPDAADMAAFIASPLWGSFCSQMESGYGVAPLIEHSTCSGAPGWNLKYKKGGRSLCTLYPAAGCFTCLIAIGGDAEAEMDIALHTLGEYARDLYVSAKPCNGSRWLMFRVSDETSLRDALALIGIRYRNRRR